MPGKLSRQLALQGRAISAITGKQGRAGMQAGSGVWVVLANIGGPAVVWLGPHDVL